MHWTRCARRGINGMFGQRHGDGFKLGLFRRVVRNSRTGDAQDMEDATLQFEINVSRECDFSQELFSASYVAGACCLLLRKSCTVVPLFADGAIWRWCQWLRVCPFHRCVRLRLNTKGVVPYDVSISQQSINHSLRPPRRHSTRTSTSVVCCALVS